MLASPTANPMPWITFYAAILKPNIILLWIVAIAWFYTLINLAQTYFFYCSRIIFAWSFDRLVPEKVCYIHPTLRSPIIAILIITLIAFVGVLDASGLFWTGSVMGAQLNFVFFAVCTQLIPVLAITLFPFTKPELFENASAFVKRKIGKVPVITIVGGITMAYLLWMLIASFLYPAVGGRIGAGTLGTSGGFIISGIVVFYVARAVPPQAGRHRYQLDLPVDPAHLKLFSAWLFLKVARESQVCRRVHPAGTLATALILLFLEYFRS